MNPNDDTPLRTAFAELHRRTRLDAPAFDAMRERALAAARADKSLKENCPPLLSVPIGIAAVCATLAALWFGTQIRDSLPHRELGISSSQRVEELLASIEIEVTPDSLPGYPTDALLTQNSQNNPIQVP